MLFFPMSFLSELIFFFFLPRYLHLVHKNWVPIAYAENANILIYD